MWLSSITRPEAGDVHSAGQGIADLIKLGVKDFKQSFPSLL